MYLSLAASANILFHEKETRHSRRILMSKKEERLFQDYQRQSVILGLDLINRYLINILSLTQILKPIFATITKTSSFKQYSFAFIRSPLDQSRKCPIKIVKNVGVFNFHLYFRFHFQYYFHVTSRFSRLIFLSNTQSIQIYWQKKHFRQSHNPARIEIIQ